MPQASSSKRVGSFPSLGCRKLGSAAIGIVFLLAALLASALFLPSEKVARAAEGPPGSKPGPADDPYAAVALHEGGADRAPLARVEREVAQALEAAASGKDSERERVERRLALILRDRAATREGKAFACEQLARVGRSASVPALVSLLREPELAPLAVRALERNPSAEAGRAIRDVLGKSQGETRLAAIHATGIRRDEAALSALEGLVRSGDETLALAALSALIAIDPPAALLVVRTRLNSNPRSAEGKRLALEAADGLRFDLPAEAFALAETASLGLEGEELKDKACTVRTRTFNATRVSKGALGGERVRVLVSTDVGGSDPDDFQSLVHLLLYADVLEIEGIVASPPGKGRLSDIVEVLRAYEADYPRLVARSAAYPPPEALERVARQGALESAPEAGHSVPTEGSRWIVERASIPDPRPLWILVWGGLSDVAQALHDRPEIASSIRIVSTGSWNTKNDPAARRYVATGHPRVTWIEMDSTFRGMYLGGVQDGELGNSAFPELHVRGKGALGALFLKKKKVIKMGDTPTVLYLLRGEPDDPTAPHWGGSFVPVGLGTNRFTDDPRTFLREGDLPGARTVSRWRADWLRDWRERMARAAPSNP